MAEWIRGKYSSSSALLASQLSLSVHYDMMMAKGSELPPYVAYVFGRRLGKRYATEVEAKAAAEIMATRLLEHALKSLKETAP